MKIRLFGGKNDGKVFEVKEDLRYLSLHVPCEIPLGARSYPHFPEEYSEEFAEIEHYSIETVYMKIGRGNIKNEEVLDKINNALNDTRYDDLVEHLEETLKKKFSQYTTNETICQTMLLEEVLKFAKNLKIT